MKNKEGLKDISKTEYDYEEDSHDKLTSIKKTKIEILKNLNKNKKTEYDYEEDPYDRL